MIDRMVREPAPPTLAKKYAAVDSWRRNITRIKVILDAGVIESGAAAQGATYGAYDLGRGIAFSRVVRIV